MSEKASEQVVREGHRAQAILSDPVFLDAVKNVEAQYVSQWRTASKVEDRERLWSLLRALDDVQVALNKTKSDGLIESRAQARKITTR